MSLAEQFRRQLSDQGGTPDSSQEAAARRLDQLIQELRERESSTPKPNIFRRWLSTTNKGTTRGVYLWGGVGRGKTVLMDLLAREMGDQAHRSHFHRFMHDVHDRLKALRTQPVENPIALLAKEIADTTKLLCFDELFVSDIADAMILGTLFENLVAHQVTMVFTSNTPPSGLYKDGLQRNRFLPTIELLERVTDVVHVDAGVDYRLRLLQKAPMFTLANSASDSFLTARFQELSTGPETANSEIELEGRQVRFRQQRGGVIWFEFAAVCEGPRSTDDYIAIARQFHTVIVSGVPDMAAEDNVARRFIALVDEFYERGVKLLLSTAHPIEQLYTGKKLSFEFRRTVSRLTEMQSTAYLGLPHRP